ncbi:MAG TPA: hypothetical protein VMN04_08285 [Thermoanaerobaculia bacterium]|nr:hypothetical protein [Thermoanaerobaculia bacterium]
MTSPKSTKARAPRSLAGVVPLAPFMASAASRLVGPLLLAEAATFAGLALSGKIPGFLIIAIRALLTF